MWFLCNYAYVSTYRVMNEASINFSNPQSPEKYYATTIRWAKYVSYALDANAFFKEEFLSCCFLHSVNFGGTPVQN